jgi:hypothetical protein
MTKIWNGGRRIAIIPVFNRQVDQQPPPDWTEQVRARAFFDPEPGTRLDRSLQRYIQTTSSGKAYIMGTVFPTVAAPDEDTVGVGLNSLPAGHGYNYAMIVLPHSMGPHRGGFAWWDAAPVNGVRNFARVAMFNDQTLASRQNIGVWAMELLHIVTEMSDLYNVTPMLDRYDIMACACGPHPSTHTKAIFGWLNGGAISTHSISTTASYTLHAVSQQQPAPSWRTTAVKVKSRVNPGHYLIEARIGTDVYDGASTISSGIPGDGVIVYEVQGEVEVYLRTTARLQVGDVFDDSDEGLSVRVTGSEPGGFNITIISEGPDRCTQLAEQIKLLQTQIDLETDFVIKKQLISALVKAQNEYRTLHCLVLVDPATELFFSPPS